MSGSISLAFSADLKAASSVASVIASTVHGPSSARAVIQPSKMRRKTWPEGSRSTSGRVLTRRSYGEPAKGLNTGAPSTYTSKAGSAEKIMRGASWRSGAFDACAATAAIASCDSRRSSAMRRVLPRKSLVTALRQAATSAVLADGKSPLTISAFSNVTMRAALSTSVVTRTCNAPKRMRPAFDSPALASAGAASPSVTTTATRMSA